MEATNRSPGAFRDHRYAARDMALDAPLRVDGFERVGDVLASLFVTEGFWRERPNDSVGAEQLVLPHFEEIWDGPSESEWDMTVPFELLPDVRSVEVDKQRPPRKALRDKPRRPRSRERVKNDRGHNVAGVITRRLPSRSRSS